jgi:ABC-type Fe3+ transport system permease subunit
VTGRDLAGIVLLIAAGIAGGMIISAVGAVILGLVGAVLGFIVARTGVRWLVAIPVVVGTVAGAVLGWAVTHAFCRPDGCPVGESIAAALTGVASFIGIGLVVALATRSFDEYRESAAAQYTDPNAGSDSTDE